jgi:Domain of unknown function (DUF3854)/Domain of unknown function (DUF927)
MAEGLKGKSDMSEIKLWKEHLEVLSERAISAEYGWACGLRSWSGQHAAEQLKQYKVKSPYPGLPLYRHGTGIEIPYLVEASDKVERCRIRLDKTSITVEEEAGNEGVRSHGVKTIELPRYVAQAGVPVTIYRPPVVRLERGGELVPWSRVRSDTSVALHITEAPLKALALSDHGLPAIGLGGVLAGPHATASTLADYGDVDPRSVGSTLRPSPDLMTIDWRGRTAYVVFDANLAFRPLVALGAARLAYLLEGLGADVRITRVPLWTPHDTANMTAEEMLLSDKGEQDQGPDDFIQRNGIEAFRTLIEASEPAGVVQLIQHRTQGMAPKSPERRQVLGAVLEDLYCRAYCDVRGDTFIAAHVAAAMAPEFRVTAIRASVKEFKEKISEAARKQDGEDKPDFRVVAGKLMLGERDIADFSARIEEEVISDDGAEQSRVYRVAGELATGGGLPTVDVDAKDFPQMHWVGERWGARATMRTKHWSYVAEGIQRLSTPVTTTRYTHFGWRTLNGNRAYLLPGGAVTKDGPVDVTVDAPERLGRYRLGQMPTDDEPLLWSLRILDVAPRHITVPALLSVYMAPMVDMLGPTFILWLHGPSGSAKSTFASLLQLHYGDFSYKTLPETWTSTVNALEASLWAAKDVLLTVDNLVPAQTARDQSDQVGKAVRLIQSYGDGASRGRLNADAETRASRPPRCMPLATAEILPPENVSTLGRILTLPFGGVRYDFALHDEIKAKPELLQSALAGWIQYLSFFEVAVFKRVFEAKRAVVAKLYEQQLKGGHPRLAEHLALCLTTKEFLFGYLKFGMGLDQEANYPGDNSHINQTLLLGLAEAALKQPGSTSLGMVEELGAAAVRQAPAVQQWLSTLRTLITTGQYGLAPHSGASVAAPDRLEVGERWIPKVGWAVGDEVWLLPGVAHDAVRRHMGAEWRWGDKEFQSQLRPYLAMTDGKNLGIKRAAGGGRPRVWVLPYQLVSGERVVVDEPDLAEEAV